MTTSTLSFFIALVGIVGMISLKSFEIKRGKKLIFSRLAEKTDHFVQKIYNAVRAFISHLNKHNAIALVQWVAYYILSWLRKMYIHLHTKAHAHPHSKKVIDMVRGKGELPRSGGASFYLKRISEEN